MKILTIIVLARDNELEKPCRFRQTHLHRDFTASFFAKGSTINLGKQGSIYNAPRIADVCFDRIVKQRC